jgi:hypothetical protein
MVNIQRPEYGGGEMYFDGVLVRKDGRFVIEELEGLNPENLKLAYKQKNMGISPCFLCKSLFVGLLVFLNVSCSHENENSIFMLL